MTDVSALEGYAGQLSEAAAMSVAAAHQNKKYIHGSATEDVQTESGPVPTIAKQAKLYLESIPDAVADLSGQIANGRIYNSFAEAYPETNLNQHFWVSPAGSGLPVSLCLKRREQPRKSLFTAMRAVLKSKC
jgi:hypothetical protein